MKDNRLLASAALFRELYDNNKDIYDVISEFIRASIILNSNWSFNVSECTHDLESIFGFQIPDAVINTCLKNRLKRNGEIDLNRGIYSVTEKFDRSKTIENDFDIAKNEYDETTKSLVEHIKRRSAVEININEEKKIISSLNDYLLDQNISDEYSEYISHFLITHQNDEGFKEKLNQIEEGLVLYAGVKYSADLSTLGTWNGNLVVFLDTEHLFSATELNGVLYKKIFDDFNSLVKEVNTNKRKSGSIVLRYFNETNSEVENFFYAAEKIVENHSLVDPSKTAMLSIIKGCRSKSDVLERKATFLDYLRKLRIEREGAADYYENTEFNIESAETISKLKERFGSDDVDEKYSCILKLFTKINNLRKGKNNVGIENISAIFMTENHLTQAIAFSDEVYFGNRTVPFSTNIEFLTERLWFKLNKGFGKEKNTPASFDVITKAKIVLSSQVNNSVSVAYKELKERHDNGKITKEEAALLIAELRNKASKPEEYTPDNIEEPIDFLDQDFIEKVLREKTILERTSKNGERAIEELRKIERERHIERLKPFKRNAQRLYRVQCITLFVIFPLIVSSLLIYSYSESDTLLSVIFGVISIVGFLAAVVKIKLINSLMLLVSKRYYKHKILNIKNTLNK